MKKKMIVVAVVVLMLATAGCVVSKYGSYGEPTVTSELTPTSPPVTSAPTTPSAELPTATSQLVPTWWPVTDDICPPFAPLTESEGGEYCDWPGQILTEMQEYKGGIIESGKIYLTSLSEITVSYESIVIDMEGTVHHEGDTVQPGWYVVMRKEYQPWEGKLDGWVLFTPVE